MGVKADKQKEEWYQSKGTYCTSARTRSPANPKSRAFGSARGLLRRRCRLSIKRWWVGARSTGRSNCSAPTAQPHWSSLCCVADMDVQTVIYICIQNGEVSVGGCVYDPRCQIKNNEKNKKKQRIFSPRGHYFLHWTSRISEAARRNPPCLAPLTHSCRRSFLLPTLHTAVLPFCSSRSHFTATAATSPRQR